MDRLKHRAKNDLSKGRMQEHHNYLVAKLTKAGKHVEAAAKECSWELRDRD